MMDTTKIVALAGFWAILVMLATIYIHETIHLVINAKYGVDSYITLNTTTGNFETVGNETQLNQLSPQEFEDLRMLQSQVEFGYYWNFFIPITSFLLLLILLFVMMIFKKLSQQSLSVSQNEV